MMPRPLKAGVADVMRQTVNSSAEFIIINVTHGFVKIIRTTVCALNQRV